MIDKQMLNDSQLSLDDEAMIHNPKRWEGLYKIFSELDET